MNHYPYKFDTSDRNKHALEIAVCYSQIDGAHHKAWSIDQMVRALTGCPIEREETKDYNGVPYSYEYQGESDEYKTFIKEACDGEDGPDTYDWDTGIAP